MKKKGVSINRCNSLNAALNTCVHSGALCLFMDDPITCVNYDEGIAIQPNQSQIDSITSNDTRPVNSVQRDNPENVESNFDFITRSNDELRQINSSYDDGKPTVLADVEKILQPGTHEYMEYWRGLTDEQQKDELKRRNAANVKLPSWF